MWIRGIVAWLVVGLACRPEAAGVAPAAPPSVPRGDPEGLATVPAREVADDVLAGLQARFAELRGYVPAPSIAPPTWLRQGTLWFADVSGCRPIWRSDEVDVRPRALAFCVVETGDVRVECRQNLEIDGSIRVLARHGCTHGASARARARAIAAGRGKGGGGGMMETYPAEPFGMRLDGPHERARGEEWVPVTVGADHAVFVKAWRFALHTAAARVEESCLPGSIPRARAAVSRVTADPGAQAEALRQRFGIDGEVRRCVVVEEERLERGAMPPVLAFEPRIRNVRTEDIVDCGAPCPGDPEGRERRYLEATTFVATPTTPTMVLYRDRKSCEAGALRSTVALSDAPCRRIVRE